MVRVPQDMEECDESVPHPVRGTPPGVTSAGYTEILIRPQSDHDVVHTDHDVVQTDHVVIQTNHGVLQTDDDVVQADHDVFQAKSLVYLETHDVLCTADDVSRDSRVVGRLSPVASLMSDAVHPAQAAQCLAFSGACVVLASGLQPAGARVF